MLTLDYANCLSTRVGEHGLDPAALAPGSDLAQRAAEHTRSLESTRGTGWERWRDLPAEPARSKHTKPIHEYVNANSGRFDNLLVLGIGGSALGNIALQAALNPPTYNLLPDGKRPGPRVFIVDNVDPAHLKAHLECIQAVDPKLERTLFNVVSKSGETAETAAQFLTVRQMLIDAMGQDKHAEHIVAITDPEKGTMRSICDDNGYTTFPVPEGVGGRFSVLSPVGLFSAAMAGIDIDALLDGAAAMDAACSKPDLHANPAAMLATLLVELGLGRGVASPKPNHVLMPYANGLYLLADWFRQLWAESLGKRINKQGDEVFAGFTPIKALGTTDQHSQVQLYREGPNDKVLGLIEVDTFNDRELTIPPGLGHEKLAYLEGRTFGELLNAEKRATEFALVQSQRPNFTIRFPAIDARRVGQFITLFEVATAYAGLMLDIDAYDQPAVETGKLATFGLMGRAGYDQYLTEVKNTLTKTDHVV
jgi:glucose-6-phosphate isomerase